MTWQLLIIISVLLTSVGLLLQKVLVSRKENDPWTYAVLFQLLVGLLLLFYSFATTGKGISLTIPLYHPNIIFMTICWTLANIFIFKALRVTEASVFTILYSTRSLFATIAGAAFLKEYLNLSQIFGILLIILGTIVVTFKKSGFKISKAEVYTILSALFVGLAVVNDRILVRLLDINTYSIISYLFPAILIFLIKPSSLLKIRSFLEPKQIKNMLTLGIVWTGFSLTFNNGLKIAPSASQAISVSVTSIILTVILAAIFLKERDNLPKKIAGSLIGLLGLFLVSK